MKLVSGIVDSGFFAQSALSAEVATKDSLGRNISETYLTGVDLTDYATTAWVTGQGYLTAETDWTNTITAASAYAYSEATAQIPTDYATTAQLADKLDSSIYANDSGTFLTAHQSLPESADWNSAASTVSAGYANWDASYATLTANSANWLTAVPAGTMNESNFGYDASNNITAYNGSAFKAGDEFPQSATEAIEVVTGGSANWNSTTATVNANSGAWGGSGIEISAGFGIDIQLVDNKLVISLATATGDI